MEDNSSGLILRAVSATGTYGCIVPIDSEWHIEKHPVADVNKYSVFYDSEEDVSDMDGSDASAVNEVDIVHRDELDINTRPTVSVEVGGEDVDVSESLEDAIIMQSVEELDGDIEASELVSEEEPETNITYGDMYGEDPREGRYGVILKENTPRYVRQRSNHPDDYVIYFNEEDAYEHESWTTEEHDTNFERGVYVDGNCTVVEIGE